MNREVHVVRLWVDTDRWRYRCPEGHPSWRPSGNQFYCQACSRDPAIDSPMHESLLDGRTGEMIARERFDLRDGRSRRDAENGRE